MKYHGNSWEGELILLARVPHGCLSYLAQLYCHLLHSFWINHSLIRLFIFRISRMSDMVLDTKDTIRLQGCECHAGNLHKALWGSDEQIIADNSCSPRESWEVSRTSYKWSIPTHTAWMIWRSNSGWLGDRRREFQSHCYRQRICISKTTPVVFKII